MKIKNAVEYLKLEDLKADEDPLVYFLENYQEKYHKVYRALALMDHKEMEEKLISSSNKYSLADIPSILTIRYNAWQYQNEREAWAGLASEIPKEIEKSMTCAQRLRCRWRHAWKEHRSKMILELFLPCFLALFLSVLVALVLWRLFSRSKDKELVQLKYGSIPLTIVAAVWVVIKQVNSVLKPISDQIMGYLSIPNHSVNLGYQHQVISDIKFSKKEFGEKPSRKWKLVSFLWRFCGLFPDNVKGTFISKSPPACKDDIRIIVFVDDLDRCRDAVILKVLSAVNLVLAACEISVILGMDKEMVIRAIHSQYKNDKAESAADLAEKYLSKIVQLPLALQKLKIFVEQQLGPDFQASCVEDCDSDANKEDPNTDGRGYHCALDMEGCGSHYPLDMESSTKSCLGLVSKNFQSFNPVTRFTSRLFKCKLGTEDSTSERLKTPLKMMLLLPNYTPKERIAISWLSEKAARLERLPREWKQFLTYHRLAWNILYQSKREIVQAGSCNF